MNPDPDCLFMTPSHREAFAGLLYAVSRRKGFVVLIGDAGTGKTTLLRALMRSADGAQFSLIFTPRVTPDEFLEMALVDFGVTDVPATKSRRIILLQKLLMDEHMRGKAPMLIVDEAHTLSPDTLEEIRLMTNFETTEEKLLQIVLAGQNDLAAILNRHELRQLKQRIEVRMELKPLSAEEVRAYIDYRWQRAGGTLPSPFHPVAIQLIVRSSRGIPRLVNSICDSALLLAYAVGARSVSAGHIQHVVRDLDLGERDKTRAASEPVVEPAPAPHRSLIAPRTLLGVEDDAPLQQPSRVMRWADKMGIGSLQAKRDRE